MNNREKIIAIALDNHAEITADADQREKGIVRFRSTAEYNGNSYTVEWEFTEEEVDACNGDLGQLDWDREPSLVRQD